MFSHANFVAIRHNGLASPGIWTRASAVAALHFNHYAIIYHSMANSRQPIKLSVLSVPPPPSKLGLLSLPLLPPHWFSTKCSHGSPFHPHRGSPHLKLIHTQALAENHIHPQQSVHILQPHCSYTLYPSHSTTVSWRDLYITSWSPLSFIQAVSMAVILASLQCRTGASVVGAQHHNHQTTSYNQNPNLTVYL